MAYNDKSLKRKKSKKNGQPFQAAVSSTDPTDSSGIPITDSLHRLRLQNDSPNSLSHRSASSENSSNSPTLTRKGKRKKSDEIEMGIKNVEVLDNETSIHTVEVLKRPGQTLGFYITEGNGRSTKGVFISRIADGSIVQRNGLLKVGDEIQAINSVNVTRTNLDDVVVLMSIPKKLVLTIRSSKKRGKDSRQQLNEPRPVFVPKSFMDDTENGYPMDLNTEGSNDSGLSSEHSIKGERREQEYISPPLSLPYSPINQEPIYSKPATHPQSELYVSDGEHEYTPVPRARSSKPSYGRREARTGSADSRRNNSTEAYISDPDLTPSSYSNSLPPPPDEMWNAHPQSDNHLVPAPPSHNGFTSEMQHWLRKFDHMSEELNTIPDNQRERTHRDELDGYRNQLQQQERLLNHAIYNMESALNVDTMLQQPTQPLAATLPRHSTTASQPPPPESDPTTPDITSKYAYLRDLPLLVKAPMKIRMDDFTIYKPEYNINPATNDGLSRGSMKVRIYCGHGLKSSRTSLRDLYCVVQLDRMRITKTMIRTGAMNFDWDETFDMPVDEGTGNLLCMIYHWDPHIRHRLCFTGTIKLGNLFNPQSSTPQNHKCALKLEPRGVLYLEISYCVSPATSDMSRASSLLFGRHLREVLENEATGTNIPLLVTKCVDEVNSRGLKVVGIYRLCGASRKKQQVRDMFEQHPHLVDLSPSNVPEIHAITGLLKDYLRELPDSLLTRRSYSLVEAALTRDTTQDSDVDSQEVVSQFIANLHHWQQGTVVFLINHLKLISVHQTENRMSAANLAVCFGPVFTPPTLTQTSDDPDTGKNGLDTGKDSSLRLHIEVLKYLLDIWPQQLNSSSDCVM